MIFIKIISLLILYKRGIFHKKLPHLTKQIKFLINPLNSA
ncbi:hypothetical protein HMPREF0621_0742 [Pasteurella dagmatis ATCC 43325]|uniref:Uncharacterized protein n=1 Tax=Pasteurella dagmatis ATCC 43325 TaxID=667128 RepID=C9PP18_9PAST|nr:hypothetical protein HMPREF0621_0742 [Pasteurella dagmatis ATCC 43325]